MISVFEPRLSINDKLSVMKTLLNNEISGTSPIVSKFEKACAEKFDRRYGVAVSNGSVALDLAFQLIDFSEGDEVILPSFTIVSCLSAITRSKATPVFCDVNGESWNMTLEQVKEKTTSKTRAILMVHLYGLTAEADKISKYCGEKNIILIEDSAEAHGQQVNSKKCGSFGLMSTMSFYANKHITTGEGGIILTDSKEIYEKANLMRNLGFKSEKRFQHDEFYWNYRMGGLQASLGISQLASLDNNIQKKINQGNYYLEKLDSIKEKIKLPMREHNNVKNHYWVFGVVLKKNGITKEVIKSLDKLGIQTRPFFWPLHLQKALKNIDLHEQPELPVSENLGKNGFYIPIGGHLSKSKQNYISKSLIRIVNDYY